MMSAKRNNFSLYDLTGKVDVVTGFGQSLGKWIAIGISEAGANILVADLNPENAEGSVKRLNKLGRKVMSMEVDVTNVEGTGKMMELEMSWEGWTS